ncbi:alcohol dehydrogenase catalytic domain-containing protein [Streptomyces sp. NPDC020817]|uniref:alcohol dehydrogenase catalytic domain-containing protein n=1 Tax=Streptomyces sp. NPDC020817 TaxID=3365095 RepID=UPI003799890C
MQRAVAHGASLPVEDDESRVDIELPVPLPGPHDLLVRVEAVAVNPVDCKRRNNDPGGRFKVLGWDAAGTVVAVGDEVHYAGGVDRPGTNESGC